MGYSFTSKINNRIHPGIQSFGPIVSVLHSTMLSGYFNLWVELGYYYLHLQ